MPQPNPPPGSLSSAMVSMPGAVEKDARNKHAGYDYASADAVYHSIRQHLATNGLAPWQTERDTEIIPPKDGDKWAWLRVTYALAITPDGKAPQEGGSELVTVMVQITGAQSFQAARTYALKYFLRGKLLLATGEFDDVDALEPAAPPAPEASRSGRWEQDPKTLLYTAAGDWPDDRERMGALFRLLRTALEDPKGIAVVEANRELVGTLPQPGQDWIEERISVMEEGRQTEGTNE